MKIIKTWFKTELEITPKELNELAHEGEVVWAILNWIYRTLTK